jgi:hypothetical protein
MNIIIEEWREKPRGFIAITKHLQPDTILFADDLVLPASSEGALQQSIYS